MKKTFLTWAFALISIVAVSSCSSAPSEQPATEVAAPAQTEATAVDTTAAETVQMAYICPMECEGSASMEPGKCPVCGMDLVKNPAVSAGNAHVQ